MNAQALLGLVALVPATFNISPQAATNMVTVLVCSGSSQIRVIDLPIGAPALPGAKGPGCCAKGCHTGGSRKRGVLPG